MYPTHKAILLHGIYINFISYPYYPFPIHSDQHPKYLKFLPKLYGLLV